MFNILSNPFKWLVGLCLALLLCLSLWWPTLAQTPIPPAAPVGRYHLATNKNFVYFVDTQTGRVWWQFTGNSNVESLVWQEMNSPAAPTP